MKKMYQINILDSIQRNEPIPHPWSCTTHSTDALSRLSQTHLTKNNFITMPPSTCTKILYGDGNCTYTMGEPYIKGLSWSQLDKKNTKDTIPNKKPDTNYLISNARFHMIAQTY